MPGRLLMLYVCLFLTATSDSGSKNIEKELHQTISNLRNQLADHQDVIRSLARSVDELRSEITSLSSLEDQIRSLQWDNLHVGALSVCGQLSTSRTRAVTPFVEDQSCSETCSGTRYPECVAVVRLNILHSGQSRQRGPLGEIWVREGACSSPAYYLGSELIKSRTTGYYTACCCGWWGSNIECKERGPADL